MTSIARKLSWKNLFGLLPDRKNTENEAKALEAAEAKKTKEKSNDPFRAIGTPEQQATYLRSQNNDQLSELISRAPERSLIRLLQCITDQTLQARVISTISQEAILKRIGRSEVTKKTKKLAEKRLQELTRPAIDPLAKEMQEISVRIEDFFKNPDWSRARQLLNEASQLDLSVDQTNQNSVNLEQFIGLRQRLRADLEAYDKTHREIEEARRKIESQNRAKPIVTLSEPDPSKAEQAITSNKPSPIKLEKKTEVIDTSKELQRRRDAIASFKARLVEIGENLTHPNAGREIRLAQADGNSIKKLKNEFPSEVEEVEELLKNVLIKRKVVVDEAQWSMWARTDLAIRIQAKIEQTVVEYENKTDLTQSENLIGRLIQFSEEMRGLGSLDPEKDRLIWAQFKTLSDRGRAICEKMNQQILDQVKTLLIGHLDETIENSSLKAGQPIVFKPSAFEEDVSTQVRKSQASWNRMGKRQSEESYDVETDYFYICDLYFRQFNRALNNQKRLQDGVSHRMQGLLAELIHLSKNQAISTLERVRLAKRLNERWPTPIEEQADASGAEVREKFDALQTQITASLHEDLKRQLGESKEIQSKLLTILADIKSGGGNNLTKATHDSSLLENEIHAIDRFLAQSKSFLSPEAQSEFQSVHSRIIGFLTDVQSAVKEATVARAAEKNRVLIELESLALSKDREMTQPKFEELRMNWKAGAGATKNPDPAVELLFNHVCKFYMSRVQSEKSETNPKQKADYLERRRELILCLEALVRVQESRATRGNAHTPEVDLKDLHLEEAQRPKIYSIVLEYGLKYNQIISLDPKTGIIKEIQKIMDDWCEPGMADEEVMPSLWNAYLARIHKLLNIHV